MVYSNLSENVSGIYNSISMISENINGMYTTLESHGEQLTKKYSLIAKQISDGENLLAATINPGTYLYTDGCTSKPNGERGAVISFGYEPSMTGRLAITSGGSVYTSIYLYGIDYGTWKQID